jgi:dTDP-4-dehydrorhamnose 3,5-epimerase
MDWSIGPQQTYRGNVLIFLQTGLEGVYLIEIEPRKDSRGFYARTWCQKEFETNGCNSRLVQSSISFNPKKGTWRGMHYQVAPHEEVKLVRCTMGAIYDVVVDLRPASLTFRNCLSVVLTAENRSMLYIPANFAHGFLTLDDNTEVLYQMSEFYSPESSRGFRWNDPYFDIKLPLEVAVISARDRDYPDFSVKL